MALEMRRTLAKDSWSRLLLLLTRFFLSLPLERALHVRTCDWWIVCMCGTFFFFFSDGEGGFRCLLHCPSSMDSERWFFFARGCKCYRKRCYYWGFDQQVELYDRCLRASLYFSLEIPTIFSYYHDTMNGFRMFKWAKETIADYTSFMDTSYCSTRISSRVYDSTLRSMCNGKILCAV